jgi:hypothetical protein
MPAPLFRRYIGIDYSGAALPDSRLKGLQVSTATPAARAELLTAQWTRRGVAEWLQARLAEDTPTLVGIDHGLSFPLAYFERHQLPLDWPAFLEDFHHHWPTDAASVESLRPHAARTGNSRWRRLCEIRSGSAKSVFHFDVPGSVAKSTHAGLPWLLRLKQQLGPRVHFWPFDGWQPPPGISVLAESYPSLWNKSFPADGRTPDEHDAFTIAAWMRQTDAQGELGQYLNPPLTTEERITANIEGWILGVA